MGAAELGCIVFWCGAAQFVQMRQNTPSKFAISRKTWYNLTVVRKNGRRCLSTKETGMPGTDDGRRSAFGAARPITRV